MIVSIDSRAVTRPEETVFYALKGQNNDGHDYVERLYSRGVRHFVLSEHRAVFDTLDGASIRYVDDTLEALQEDAALYRQQCRAEVTAITGSNGKTVVKEWIAQLLGEDLPLCRSPRSYNSQVGVPLSILEITPDCRIALIEAGMSRPGEMARLHRIIRPDIGVFTHLGDAHGENFPSPEAKMREKALLFAGCRTVICREGMPARIIREQCGPQTSLCLWGESPEADVRVLGSSVSVSGREVDVEYLRSGDNAPERGILHLPFADEASFEDCMTAVTFMLCHGYTLGQLAPRVADLQPVAMRMEIREGINGCTLIKDYYNSDPASFALALGALAVQDNARPKVVILSDFVDVEGGDGSIYREVAAQLRKAGVTRFVGIGPCLSRCRAFFDVPQTRFYETTEAFLAGEKREDYRDMGILIKGARQFPRRSLRRLALRLSAKSLQWSVPLLERLASMHADPNGPWCFYEYAGDRERPVFRREDIYGVRRKMRFAGHEFSVPSNPDVYLESLYGDYMTPPPPQARQTHIRALKFLSEG